MNYLELALEESKCERQTISKRLFQMAAVVLLLCIAAYSVPVMMEIFSLTFGGICKWLVFDLQIHWVAAIAAVGVVIQHSRDLVVLKAYTRVVNGRTDTPEEHDIREARNAYSKILVSKTIALILTAALLVYVTLVLNIWFRFDVVSVLAGFAATGVSTFFLS